MRGFRNLEYFMLIRSFIATALFVLSIHVGVSEEAHHATATETAHEQPPSAAPHNAQGKEDEHSHASAKKEEHAAPDAHESHAPTHHQAADTHAPKDTHGKSDHQTDSHEKADHHQAAEHGGEHKDTHSTHAEHEEKSGHSHSSTDEDEPSAEKMLEVLRSQVRYQSPQVSEALANAIIKVAPRGQEAAEALLLLARTAAAEERFGEAIIFFEQWRMIVFDGKLQNRETPIALLELGRAYRNIGALRIANETFYLVASTSRSVEKTPSPIVKLAQWEVAETTYTIKDWGRARKLYEMFISTYTPSDPLSHSCFYRIAECDEQLGNDDQTAISYQQAVTYNPKHPKAAYAHLALMNIFLKRKNYPMVSESINQISKSVAGSGAQEILAWKERVGEALFHHMFSEQAYEYSNAILDSLAKMDSSSAWQAQVKRWKGLSSLAEGSFETALELLPSPISTQPTTAEALEAEIIAEQRKLDDQQATLRSYAETAQWILDFKKKQRDLELYVTPDFQKPKTSL